MVVELLRDGVGRELLKAVAGNVTLTGMELLIVRVGSVSSAEGSCRVDVDVARSCSTMFLY